MFFFTFKIPGDTNWDAFHIQKPTITCQGKSDSKIVNDILFKYLRTSTARKKGERKETQEIKMITGAL